MKKNVFVTASVAVCAVLFFVLFSSTIQSHSAGDFKYVGVSKCVTCHKSDAAGKQLDIWQNSAHAKAWKTLESEAADKIAKDKGFSTKASETPACIKCHVLGKDINPAELTDSFDKAQGVQCESCHGAGSEYKAMSIMKDKPKAIENGLIVPSDIASLCTGCHNSESPTAKPFNFDEMWAKIKHAKP
ncbi:MAG: cytochrome c family protein [Ignavibacteriae bacterium]|jgi:excinuclease UvrABC ATPase subunit|nr:cytochrome c family protein [Ignavibacteriota bacterium]